MSNRLVGYSNYFCFSKHSPQPHHHPTHSFCRGPLHLLPLCGANMVLGVQWLKTLGSIMIDYNTLSMKFFHEGHLVKFQRDTDPISVLLTPPQLHQLAWKQGASAYFHIAITPSEFPSNQSDKPPVPPKEKYTSKRVNSSIQQNNTKRLVSMSFHGKTRIYRLRFSANIII